MLKISRESEINLINVLIDNDIISGKDLVNIKKVSTEKVIEVQYPYTGEVIGTVPAGRAEHAKEALDIAARYNPKLTRYQKTRLEQKLYFLDRASVKSYDYKNCNVILRVKRQDKNVQLFFRKER